MKKVLILLSIVSSLIGLLVLFSFLIQRPNSEITTGQSLWLDYGNLDFGFNIKFSSNYEYRVFSNPNNDSISINFSPKGKLDALNTIVLQVAKHKSRPSLNSLREAVASQAKATNFTEEQIDGKKALTFDFPTDNNQIAIHSTLTISGNNVYELKHAKGYSDDLYIKMLESLEYR
jgi:hypothetical protein